MWASISPLSDSFEMVVTLTGSGNLMNISGRGCCRILKHFTKYPCMIAISTSECLSHEATTDLMFMHH